MYICGDFASVNKPQINSVMQNFENCSWYYLLRSVWNYQNLFTGWLYLHKSAF